MEKIALKRVLILCIILLSIIIFQDKSYSITIMEYNELSIKYREEWPKMTIDQRREAVKKIRPGAPICEECLAGDDYNYYWTQAKDYYKRVIGVFTKTGVI
jgi:hypothetical protein